MATNERTYRVEVSDADPEEAGQVLAALKDLEAEANKSIDGTVSVETEQDSLETGGFARAGETDA